MCHMEIATQSGIRHTRYITVGVGEPRAIDSMVVEEAQVCVSVNGRELANFMCSPTDLDRLALGFLYNEGLIASLADVRQIHISKHDTCVDVWLNHDIEMPERLIITAGCGGGVTFDDFSQRHEPLVSETRATPEQLATLMRAMHQGADLYQQARGIHTAALATPDAIFLQLEDIGRHNCLDKLRGAALQQGLATRDTILLSSGRVSSEMINKARRLETPIVCSRTSPTSLSVALAEVWNITLVAYLRQDRMRIYTHPARVIGAQQALNAQWPMNGQA